MPELLLALSASALVQWPTVPWPKGRTATTKLDQPTPCHRHVFRMWCTRLWGAAPQPDAHHCSTTCALTSLLLLPSPAAWPCCLMTSYESLSPSLSLIPATWSCSYGPLLSAAWKRCSVLVNKCDMDQGAEWWQRPSPTCCTWNRPTSWLAFWSSLIISAYSSDQSNILYQRFSGFSCAQKTFLL